MYQSDKSVCSCGKDMTRSSSGTGFWEGGKGTRDRMRMSKNDDRKYKGLMKTKSRKAR